MARPSRDYSSINLTIPLVIMKNDRIFVTQSFRIRGAVMPSTYGHRAFFMPSRQAIAIIAVVASCAIPVIGMAVPCIWNFAAGSAATAILLLTPEGCDRANHLQSDMYTNNNCRTIAPGSPAKAAISPEVTHLISTFFTSPIDVQDMRRDLRRWFVSNLEGQHDNFGSSLADQIQHYEVLDELLHEVSAALTNTSCRK
jgi:hypothetical protein